MRLPENLARQAEELKLPFWVHHLSGALAVLSPLAVAYALWVVFARTPNEVEMGIIQKVFYFHLPLAIGCFLAFFVVALGGIMYLMKGSYFWDCVSYTAAEVGVLSCVLVCVTGSLWARGTWGVYWTADPRLTTTLILLFIYVGYLLLRSSAADQSSMRSLAAVTGIVGFATVPLVYFSVHLWNTIHPVVITTERVGLSPEIRQTLLLSFPVGLLFMASLWLLRLRSACLWEQLRLCKLARTLGAEEAA